MSIYIFLTISRFCRLYLWIFVYLYDGTSTKHGINAYENSQIVIFWGFPSNAKKLQRRTKATDSQKVLSYIYPWTCKFVRQIANSKDSEPGFDRTSL